MEIKKEIKREKTKNKLFIVPHIYSDSIRFRGLELAKRLTKWYEIYLVRWKSIESIAHPNPFLKRYKQLLSLITSFIRPTSYKNGPSEIIYVDIPVLQTGIFERTPLVLKARSICRTFNTRSLTKAMEKVGARKLLMESIMFDIPRLKDLDMFYDIVDWFDEHRKPQWIINPERRRFKNILSNCKSVFAISHPIIRRVQELYGIKSVFIPNGADIQKMRAVNPQEVKLLKDKLRLSGKYIIGYIGNHGKHNRIDFLLDICSMLKSKIPDAYVLVVGDYTPWKLIVEEYMRNYKPKNLAFIGPVPPEEVDAYFNLIDVGVLLCEGGMFRDYAMPIKVIEYSACRKFVISTDTEGLRPLNLPNVKLIRDRGVETWVEAILEMRGKRWMSSWDRIIENFDWKNISHNLAEHIG
jgi:glycosyltransferase involved in cell wall biosynthesis